MSTSKAPRDSVTTSPADGPGSEGSVRSGRAMIIGTGLIGGSVGMALRAQGWHVTGSDTTPGTAARAVELGALDAEGEDRGAELVVVATPVMWRRGSSRTCSPVTDGTPTQWSPTSGV